MYVVFTTDWSAEQEIMGRSVLAVSEDDGRSFKAVYDLSRSAFINVSFCSTGDWLYLFGSGAYRKSSVFLARVKPSEFARRSSLRYFTGADEKGQPQWSAREQDAVPLFRHDVIGEFSVAYCPPVARYVLIYNSGSPRGITLRSALTPWGPWSDGQILFDPWRDNGYGNYMHISSTFKADRGDSISDAGREAEWGGEYGPYIMARYTTGVAGRCRLFFTLSTWNHYQVVVMQTDLKLEAPADPPSSRLPYQ
jgi:hypothetical protein